MPADMPRDRAVTVFGASPSVPVPDLLAFLQASFRSLFDEAHARPERVYVRLLSDVRARGLGLRWFFLGYEGADVAPSPVETFHGWVLDHGDIIRCRVTHDPHTNGYEILVRDLYLRSRGALLSRARSKLTLPHPQAGLTNAELRRIEQTPVALRAPETRVRFAHVPTAVELGLRQYVPQADPTSEAYLEVLSAAECYLLWDRVSRGRAAPTRVDDVHPYGFVCGSFSESELPQESDVLVTREDEDRRLRIDARHDEARALALANASDAAERLLESIVEEDPRRHQSWALLGDVLARRGAVDRATVVLTTAVNIALGLNADEATKSHLVGEPLHALLRMLRAHGRSEEAYEIATWALDFAPHDAEVRASLAGEDVTGTSAEAQIARRLVSLGKLDEARDVLESAMDRKPTEGAIALELGYVYMELERPDLAWNAFNRAIAMGTGSATTHYNVACMAARLGDRDEAIAALGRAIALDASQAKDAAEDVDFALLHELRAFRALVGMP